MGSPNLDPNPGAVTHLLQRLQTGDRTALPRLVDLVYPELRRVARGLLRNERPDHVLQPTALVNEAYLRLVAHERQDWQNRAHFFGAAAQLMRRILVDYARASSAKKRRNGSVVEPEPETVAAPERSVEIIALDAALNELEGVSARQARIVELRYFGGLSVPETAEALGLNPRTVDRDWAAARVWLRRKLRP